MVVDQLELVDQLAPCHPAGGGAAAVGHLAAGVDQAALLVEEQLGSLQPPELALVEFEQVSWQLPATISIRLCTAVKIDKNGRNRELTRYVSRIS